MKQRIIFLDWLRVIACLMVMTVHACECVYSDDYTFSFPSESAKYAVFFYQSLVRPTAVPLFLMASAFLLVPVKTDALQFFKKRFTRVLIPLLVFLPIYAVLPTLWGGSDMGRSRSGTAALLCKLPCLRVTPLVRLHALGPVSYHARYLAMAG